VLAAVPFHSVLGLTRTVLIFTGLQEGSQPRGWGLTPPRQTQLGIPYRVPSGWVPGGGELGSGNSLAAREGTAAVRSESAVLFCRLCSVGLFCVTPFFCIVVVPVPSVCCSVKLPLSRPTSFCLFLSILLCTPAGGGAATWCLCCRLQPKPQH